MYRLLIADDEESIREGVADFVRQNCPEWDVAALARDGREALALAREILPDAVLTDITMPHMNGLEFLESLSDLLPEAKLLVLSGYDQFEYAVQALRLGVSDYLLKPLDTAKLVSALSRFAAELDAQALRWAQIETLRTNTQKTNELELQSYFRAALLGEELPALSAANAVFAQEGTSYCCVLCDGLDAQRALLERVLEQRLYGAVRTVLLRHRHALRRRLIAEQIIGQCALKARVEPNIKQPLHYIAQLCVHISLRLCERHIRRAARLPFHIFSHIEIQRYLARDQHGQKHRRHQQRKLYPEARVAVSTQQPFHSNPPGTKRKIPFILALHSKARKPPGRFCAAFLYKYTILPRQTPKREPLGRVLFRRLGFVFYLAVSCLSGSKLG